MDDLTCSLSLLIKLGKVLLENGKQEAEASLQDYVPNKITTLFGLITAGADLYNSLGVTKKSEAEAFWQKFFHHESVREQVEELLQLETEWDEFLERLDVDLQTTDRQLRDGPAVASLSADTPLTDARTGENVTLGRYFGKGENLLLVLIRHFG